VRCTACCSRARDVMRARASSSARTISSRRASRARRARRHRHAPCSCSAAPCSRARQPRRGIDAAAVAAGPSSVPDAWLAALACDTAPSERVGRLRAGQSRGGLRADCARGDGVGVPGGS